MSSSTDRLWVLVPAHGGSKGIPRKNLRSLAGKPLILHVLEEIARFLAKDHVIVSTDDTEIAELSGAYAIVHHRPPPLASDEEHHTK